MTTNIQRLNFFSFKDALNDHFINSFFYNKSGGEELDYKALRLLNPLIFLNANEELHKSGTLNVAGVINRSLTFIFYFAGLALFVMIVWGGFEMLTGAASKKNLDAGKQRITSAIVGFLLLVLTYWIIQIIEYITGLIILG